MKKKEKRQTLNPRVSEIYSGFEFQSHTFFVSIFSIIHNGFQSCRWDMILTKGVQPHYLVTHSIFKPQPILKFKMDDIISLIPPQTTPPPPSLPYQLDLLNGANRIL